MLIRASSLPGKTEKAQAPARETGIKNDTTDKNNV